MSPSYQPQLNCNFLVDLGSGDPHDPRKGFCEVIFPEFRIGRKLLHGNSESPSSADTPPTLILRRGATMSLDLYHWWDSERRGSAHQPRTIRVHLQAGDHTTPVLSWTFFRAHPVALSYSKLNAQEGSVLIETIEIEFDTMEMG